MGANKLNKTFPVFTNRTGHYLLCYLGEVLWLDEQGSGIEVGFIQIDEFYNRNGNQVYRLAARPSFFTVNVHVSLFKHLIFGSVWHEGSPCGYTPEYHLDKRVTIPVERPDEVPVTTLGVVLAEGHPNIFDQPARLKMPILLHRDTATTIQANPRITIFPCSVVANFFFFGSAQLTQQVLTGGIYTNALFDPAKVDTLITEHNKKVAFIKLKYTIPDSDVVKVGWMALDNYFRRKAIELHWHLIDQNTTSGGIPFIKTMFPLQDKTEFSVVGAKVNTIYGEGFFVYHILNCDHPYPFDALVFERSRARHYSVFSL